MRYISTSLRQVVIERAYDRCEYCGLSQAGQAATFHIDHVVPLAEGGQTTADNLALTCVSCSLHKAARLTVIDPDTNNEVPMYNNPRQQTWSEHFRWDGVQALYGLNSIGSPHNSPSFSVTGSS